MSTPELRGRRRGANRYKEGEEQNASIGALLEHNWLGLGLLIENVLIELLILLFRVPLCNSAREIMIEQAWCVPAG